MTYPQPSSEKPVLLGQDHFRLTTVLASPGDMYESEVSALAFAVGPDSDFSEYQLTYFNPDRATSVAQAIISPDRDLVARIDARNDVVYPGPPGSPRRKGRILINPVEIWDARFRPLGFGADDKIAFEIPLLDVLQYFTSAPSVTPQRSDKIFRYQYMQVPNDPTKSTWLVIPCFGRKSGFFTFINKAAIVTTTVRVLGVKASISGAPGIVGTFQQQLMAPVALLSDQSTTYKFLSSVDGLWDMFAIQFQNYSGAAIPTTVTLSDDPE